jgi:hypothetical protein
MELPLGVEDENLHGTLRSLIGDAALSVEESVAAWRKLK